MKRTVMQMMADTVQQYGMRAALRCKRDGAWQTLTWQQYYDQVRQAARSIIALGAQPGDGVVLIGANSPQWLIADLGAIFAGCMPAGIYTTNSASQCQYVAHHCEATLAFVENAEQLAKFSEIADTLPRLKSIVLMDPLAEAPRIDASVIPWNQFLALSTEVAEATLQARIKAQKPDDVCSLIYTSGTTGNPKAVMISHDNVTWTADVAMKALEGNCDDQLISYLPLSHIAEQAVSIYGPMVTGATVSFAESMDKLPENLREVRPTLFLGVPRVWEKIQAKIVAAGAAASPAKKTIAKWAKRQGLKGGYADQRGDRHPFFYGVANALVFSKVRKQLGLDRCRVQISAAAPISRDTLEFFLSLGIPIYEIYGMSESTGPATISRPGSYRTGRAGTCLPGAELKIAEDGEICMRGRHVFKGYLKNPEATAETLDKDGFLHSGDIGEIDAEGFLRITDRKKDLIITAGGENIAPQVLESHLKSIPIISQAVVIGDRRKYLSALITLDPDKVASFGVVAQSDALEVNAAAQCPKFKQYIEEQISVINTKLARVQTIRKFHIIQHDFSVEGGELTPTMKIKRRVINEKYAKEIESLYQ